MRPQITINHAPPRNDYCRSSAARALFPPNRSRPGTTGVPFPQCSSGEEKTMSGVAHRELDDTQRRSMLVRAVIASTIGTSIEWYDFFLYSIVTGLVFAKTFFPNSDPLVGTLQAFLIYAVGFAARPVGAAIFGHYGDRMGRKAALVSTLLLMGIATVLVGFVPNYSQIGVWGAVILTVLRFLQGVGVGGEWGGSVLLAMEWTR